MSDKSIPIPPPPSPMEVSPNNDFKKVNLEEYAINDEFQKIYKFIERHNYPISAAYISDKLSMNRKDVNSILYKYNNKSFSKIEHQPPLWTMINNNFRINYN